MRTPTIYVATSLVIAVTMSSSVTVAQTPEELKQQVEKTLGEERELRRLGVSVAGNEITLSGRVDNFWYKSEALRLTFDVNGVETVVSEIEMPTEEDEGRLAENVVKAIQGYSYYRMWDHLDGRLNAGTVTLMGNVTPERDKVGELFERIAKVRGVQDVQMNVNVLSASQEDARLRSMIASRLFTNEHFQRFEGMHPPPFHIVINNSVVTLIGYVQGRIERIEMQRIVAQTQGVLRVDNQLQTMR